MIDQRYQLQKKKPLWGAAEAYMEVSKKLYKKLSEEKPK